ncbi:MAG: tRNA guanosine(34) transglycosylase Tgt [Chloroflexi bacterium]|nr:tRNA guanosine(34) transglycosylase Tgt [Chloroflexota bacterium]
MSALRFEIQHRDPKTRARAGIIHTAHGDIETPGFMPVATQAAVKGLTSQDLYALDAQLLICNTYHLALRPSAEQIAQLGGLHAFMNWQRPLATDSGGFQVFSLGAAIRDGVGKIADIFPDEDLTPNPSPHRGGEHTDSPSPRGRGGWGERSPLCKIDDEGVTFNSHLDGSIIRLTPQRSIEIQHQLGADLILAFDECTSPLDTYDYTRAALGRTHRWAVRCLEQHAKTKRTYQNLFGIVQGGAYRDLREESARVIGNLQFEGLAIGGSLGKSKNDMHAILEWTIPLLPDGKPRHLLGIGEIEDILNGVERGIDLFDCAAPTRWARNGALIVTPATTAREGFKNNRLTISNARFQLDAAPVDPACECFTCQNYSRAYLHHLHRAKELSYYRLATIHNLHFMLRFMEQVRGAIQENRWEEFRAENSA